MRFRRCGNLLSVATPAKLNLFLELFGRRADGFHQIETVMMTVSLFDEISFIPTVDETIELSIESVHRGSHPREADPIPCDETNLICRALRLVREQGSKNGSPVKGGVQVQLRKRIPSAAGLGGASSDAAAALVAGNLIWQTGLDIETLSQLASKLGSDIPFFLNGGVAVCRGRGEIICPIPSTLAPIDFVIVKPDVSLATPKVFASVQNHQSIASSQPIVDSIAAGSLCGVADSMHNRLTHAAERLTDAVDVVRREFEKLPCLGHQMSGSGSSYFGIFANRLAAARSARQLRGSLADARVFHVRSLNATDATGNRFGQRTDATPLTA